MKDPHSNQPLVNYCYQHLRDSIVRGDFAPGEKLQIAKLKDFLKVGPTPIREALSRLISSGLITTEDNKGFRVKPVSETEIQDIYSTFCQIENLALQSAIDHGTTTWEANIMAALYKLSLIENSKNPVDGHEWSERNYEFHCALIAACPSACLLKIREDLYQQFDRYCHLGFLINATPLPINHKKHCEIAEAVIARDKEKACRLMSQHLKGSLEKVIKQLSTQRKSTKNRF